MLHYLYISEIKNMNIENPFNTPNIEESKFSIIQDKDITEFPKQRANIKCFDFINNKTNNSIKYSHTNEYTGKSEIIILISSVTYKELYKKAIIGWS